MRKRRALLHLVIGYQLKPVPLREHGSFVIDGTVLEVKDKTQRNPVTAHFLNQVACSYQFTLQRTQCKKAMKACLGIAHSHLFGAQSLGIQKCRRSAQQYPGPRAETLCDEAIFQEFLRMLASTWMPRAAGFVLSRNRRAIRFLLSADRRNHFCAFTC
jgi:hypothetical protein